MPATETPDLVRDVRTGYFHAAGQAGAPVTEASWLARTFRNRSGNIQITTAAGTYGGVRVRAGAATCNVIVFDAVDDAGMVNENIIDTCSAALWDGTANIPTRVQKGVRISVDQNDAIVTINYR
jgi:hypothetical protein